MTPYPPAGSFFLGLNPRWQWHRWLPDGLNVMYSAAGFWDPAAGAWRRRNRFFPWAGLRWLDSGGFTALNRWGDFPWTTPAYACLIALLRPHWWASEDYPCEPDISRRAQLHTNQDRIKATVARARAADELAPQVPGTLVPVIQGYELDEYRHCLDLYATAGLIRPYMAVGSVCRRLSSAQLHELIPGIAEAATAAGCTRLHWFGLKLSPDLHDLAPYLHSRDSSVALDAYNTDRRNPATRRFPKGQAEKRARFETFFGRLEAQGLHYCTEES
jgi:hypothetical protein